LVITLVKDILERRIKGKKQNMMQNTRLDEWRSVEYMEKLVPKACPWGGRKPKERR